MPSRGEPSSLAVLAIAILVVAVVVVASFTYLQNAKSSETSSSASSTLAGGSLIITKLYGDVISTNNPQALFSNSSTIAGTDSLNGTAGETFQVDLEIVYQACACGPQVTAVDVLTPGFTVLGTTPGLPVHFTGAGGDFYQAGLKVLVRAPPVPYSGSLTLLAHVA